jgi:hypothetical protein
VSAPALLSARAIATRFLVSNLRFAYGEASAGTVRLVTPVLRSELARQRTQVTPAATRG